MCALSSGNVSGLPLNQLINKDCLMHGAGNWFALILFILSPIIEEFPCFYSFSLHVRDERCKYNPYHTFFTISHLA